jgi:hypothetical protein
MARSLGIPLVGLLVAACSSIAPSRSPLAGIAPECASPPSITSINAEGSQVPIPIVLTCDKAVSAAFAALPATVGGPFGGDITSIQFGFGGYCPPGERCPFSESGDRGFVVFGFRDGSSYLVVVEADQAGVVSVTELAPLSTTGLPISS